MSERELREFPRGGRYSNWVRFNDKLTGNVYWRADGSDRSQSFRRDSTPDGIHHWVPARREL
jgi:hypothetical protein